MKSYVCLLPLLCCCAQSVAQVRPKTYRIETVAGSQRNGDGGPALAAQISDIRGVAIDRSGNLYLSDTDHHRVRKVTPGGTISTIAGTGVAGYSGDGGAASQAQLNLPYGLAVDATGNLYIADLGNNRIRRVWADGVITTLIPNTPLASPRNLAVDLAGNLYVSEFDGHRVRRISSDGQVTTVAGNGRAGFTGDGGAPELAQLNHPAGIAIDRGGALLIADSANNRIRRLFSNGTINTILGGSSGTTLVTPVAVAADAQGNIYVGDTAPVVRSYSLSGRWTDAAGGAVPGYSGDGGPAIRAALTSVRDLAVDVISNLYVADGMRVRRVDTLGMISTLAGDGYARAVGDNGPAQDAILSRPSAVTVDASGVLRIADTGTQRVREVTGGAIQSPLANLSEPMGVAIDGSGTLYVADTGNSVVRALGPDRKLRTVAATVKNPRGLCVDRSGTLHVADTGNGRVLRVGTSGVDILASQLSAPEACAFDALGNLYIAETGAHRVVRRSVRGDWSTVASGGFSFPRGVAVDADGNVFVSDTGGNRIRVVRPDGSVETIAGSGAPGFGGDGGDALAAILNGPAGLWVDAIGQVYFADALNDRVRRLVPDVSLAEQAEPLAVVNAMSGAAGSVAPGELVLVSGKGFGVEECEVWIGGQSVTVLQSAAGQVMVQIPDELAGVKSVRLEVRVRGLVAGVADLSVVDAAPGVLQVALNYDGSLNSGMRPSPAGSTIYLIVTGQGRLEAAHPLLPVGVTVSGVPADVLSATAVSRGLILVSVRVPGGYIGAGQSAVVLEVGSVKAAPITIWVQ